MWSQIKIKSDGLKALVPKWSEGFTYVELEKLTPELLRVFIRKIPVFEKTEKYSRTAGNPIIIHFTFQPHANTDFITMKFREDLLESEQAEIA